jgi:UDP-glucose 4-epimerase
MTRCLITGVAGFIGSRLAARLLADGHEAVGVDSLTDYYEPNRKRDNLARLEGDGFAFVEEDLLTADVPLLLNDIDVVFHEAGQPGVRGSWGANFSVYCERNIIATQRLLEAARASSIKRFVFASSSSVYGDAPDLPTRETTLPRPVSPYGVTKLAAEHLCGVYGRDFGVPTVSLRYFTVYGPGQRPDMAFHKFISAALAGHAITLHGDGEQTRDFTYIDDIVDATMAAGLGPRDITPGRVYNLGGGVRVSVNHVLEILGEIIGSTTTVDHQPAQRGDARDTYADCTAAKSDLGYQPKWTLEAGLRQQVTWMTDHGKV